MVIDKFIHHPGSGRAADNEIKVAADELFCSVPYQEITLSTIAGKLSWTRANLYKYVTTKEEIYLEICSDKMQSYFDDLFAAFPNEKPFTPDQWASAWADVLNAHRDYLRYSDILCTIIEVHVTACRLASFKTSYHAHRDAFVRLMEVRLGLSSHDASEVFLSVLYHAAVHALVDALCGPGRFCAGGRGTARQFSSELIHSSLLLGGAEVTQSDISRLTTKALSSTKRSVNLASVSVW